MRGLRASALRSCVTDIFAPPADLPFTQDTNSDCTPVPWAAPEPIAPAARCKVVAAGSNLSSSDHNIRGELDEDVQASGDRSISVGPFARRQHPIPGPISRQPVLHGAQQHI